MITLIERLHQDHVHMAELLDLLERQITLLRDAAGDADYHLMRDIAHYFTAFPDTVHHPLEDEIFAVLREKRADLGSRLDALRTEHEELAELGREFYRLMENVCAGQLVRRNLILSASENFLVRQRGHLDTEESEIFPVAAEVLSDTDVAAFEASHGQHADPLFGTELRETFTRLHDAIMEAD